MRSPIGLCLTLVALGLAGCGGSEPTLPQEKLTEMQNAQQKQADDAERAMQKEQGTKAGKKK